MGSTGDKLMTQSGWQNARLNEAHLGLPKNSHAIYEMSHFEQMFSSAHGRMV